MLEVVPRFGHTDGLLLHGLVDADAVVLLDAVEFVNAAQTAVRQDQSPRLQVPLTSILHSSDRKTFGTETERSVRKRVNLLIF